MIRKFQCSEHSHHSPFSFKLTGRLPLLSFLLKLRTRVRDFLRFSGDHITLGWAAVVGVVGAIATIAFREGIAFLETLIAGHSGSLVEMARSFPVAVRICVPTVGGLIAGFCLVFAQRNTDKNSNTDYMEAITIGEGVIPVRQSLWRSLSSLFTIATGGSIGREGSMVQLAALCASRLGSWIHLDPPRLRLLVACGAAAGITSAYNAPIAGAFFVTEIVLGSIAMESFGPVLVASVVANITMREFAGYRPPYEMPVFPAVTGPEVLLFVALGALCGLSAPHFLRLLNASKAGFNRLGLPLPLRLALGGLIVGVLSSQAPEVWGNGYSVVNAILHQPWAWSTLISILLLKIAATAATSGSGAVGGIFTPTLFVGAVAGCLFGMVAHTIWPHATSMPFAYAMVGMGAFLTAATHAPLMAILMIFEMTLSYQVVLPLMLACVVAYFVARTIDQAPMYEVTLRRNRAEKERLRVSATQMRELIRPANTVLPLTAGVPEMARIFLEYPVKYLYVIDEVGHFKGVVALKDITSDLLDNRNTSTKTAADYLHPEFTVLTPDMPLAVAFQLFTAFQGERLPVIESDLDSRLVGVVYKTSLLEAYFRMNARH